MEDFLRFLTVIIINVAIFFISYRVAVLEKRVNILSDMLLRFLKTMCNVFKEKETKDESKKE